MVLTTYCTLNCKYCLNYQPYITRKKHHDLEQMKQDVDMFFCQFDRVEYFSLTGGEPLLHKDLGNLVKHIRTNYRHKVNTLWLATNGSVVPSDELCQTIKEYDVEVICDDYTSSVPEIKKTYDQLIAKCRQFGINYKEGNNPRFFKTFPPAEDFTKWSDKQIIEKFDECKASYSGFGLEDGKLYACCYSNFASTAQLVPTKNTDYYDLANVNKKTLLEFVLGYTDDGYVNFCKYCNCFFGTKSGYDENGVTQQPKDKLLCWDVNNPTYLRFDE